MKDLRAQFVSALLFILTVAAVSCAVINFHQQSVYHLPDDGVTWVDRKAADRKDAVVALYVEKRSQAENAGIRAGDQLLSIAGTDIQRAVNVPEILGRIPLWSKIDYVIRRSGVDVKKPVIVGEAVPDSAIYYQYFVGFIYLLIGLFVYYRRVSAPRSVHFYTLCLTSFVLSCFHYTGKLNDFDQAIYWANVVAGILAPTIFLHFCLVFPERRKWLPVKGGAVLVYVPAVALLAVFFLVVQGMVRVAVPLIEIRWFLDQVWLIYLLGAYLIGALLLYRQSREVEDPLARRQVKYLLYGAVVGLTPFTFIYAVPYLFGVMPNHLQKMAVISLALIPITWAYAILRYRLMDVDIIFQQGYVYTLATLVVLGIFYGLIFSFTRPEDLNPAAIVGLILFATFIFQPIRAWLQEQLDRYILYKDQYEHRRTLIQFARELGAETNLDHMLKAVAERLVTTLSIQHVGFFLLSDGSSQFELRHVEGHKKERGRSGGDLDLSFLASQPEKPYLFFERTRRLLDVVSHKWPASVRASISELDFTYYFPCSSRGRIIGWLALSRTEKGDFLSSDDVDLVITLCGYVAIAMENALLYSSLQRKVEEYERLKEFSENIVESINVGILAADLEDRVESWNSQIEKLTGVPRDIAVGRRLSELFPSDLCERFEQVRGETGVHNIYKFVLQPDIKGVNVYPSVSNGNGHASHIVNLAIAPLVSKDSNRIGRLIIFDDITDRDELERRLVQADKLSSIGLLAAGVAHEVNTPLAVISTYAQLLAKQVSGDDQKSKLLEKIAKQTFRASEIVNSLLNFSRTSSTDFVDVDLNKVIRETVTLIEHQLQKARVEVRLNLDPSLPAVKANAGKLQQV
ncbi:MAG: PAS domain S-box protein, partial [Acidobacteriaceae bacterium]|nr:PAS domain S-box protein [Acidobacteriaceae bacterium]